MMKIALVSLFRTELKKAVRKAGLKESKKPELVIAYGGDGTFLLAEEKYPGVPKLFVYKSNTCKKCSINNLARALNGLKNYCPKKFFKIEAVVGHKKIIALNDVNIHYNPPRALRFRVRVNNKIVADNVIGDGVLISTPFGSAGYFKSITGKKFKKGIGIAFNNPAKKIRPIIVSENSGIEVEILRETGVVAHDTSNMLKKIKGGDRIKIKKSKVCANIAILKKQQKR